MSEFSDFLSETELDEEDAANNPPSPKFKMQLSDIEKKVFKIKPEPKL